MFGSFRRKYSTGLVTLNFANEEHRGVPHSLQALEGGVEFLLVFDDGSFSEDNTFLASEVFAHNPVRIPPTLQLILLTIGRNPYFPRISAVSPFLHGTTSHLENFSSSQERKHPKDIAEQNIVGSAGVLPIEQSYSYHLSKQAPQVTTAGGSVKIIDPKTFPIAEKFSAAIVTIKPGAIREIHWHTTVGQLCLISK